MSCFTVNITGMQPCTIPDLSEFFPDGRASLVLHFDRFKLPLANPFHVFYCSYAYIRRTHYNRAVAALVGGDPATRRALGWPGTMVIFKYTSALCIEYEDLTLSDVPDIRAYFTSHPAMWGHGSL